MYFKCKSLSIITLVTSIYLKTGNQANISTGCAHCIAHCLMARSSKMYDSILMYLGWLLKYIIEVLEIILIWLLFKVICMIWECFCINVHQKYNKSTEVKWLVLFQLVFIYNCITYTKILEVNLFAFAYRLFHRDFSPINGTFCKISCW